MSTWQKEPSTKLFTTSIPFGNKDQARKHFVLMVIVWNKSDSDATAPIKYGKGNGGIYIKSEPPIGERVLIDSLANNI